MLCDHGHLEAVPFVREPVAHLAAEGFGIDLMAASAAYGYAGWTPVEGVRHLVVSDYRRGPTMQDARTLLWLATRGLVRDDYVAVLATPVVSVVFGAALAALWRVPLVVFSDELYTEADGIHPHPRWRRAMYRAHARAALTVITDLRRAEVLRNDSALLDGQPFVELPNSPAGQPSFSGRDDFRKWLGIARDEVMVLHSGGLWTWSRAPELISELPNLAANTVVVYQMNKRAEDKDRELYRLLEDAYPVRFLTDPVPYAQVDEAVTASDIGLALYRDPSPNLTLTGKGSGKIGRYLRAGKPVIVDRGGGVDWVAEFGAGVVITSTAELPAAIDKIMANYDRYAERARACHAEHMSFERYWPVVRSKLADVIGAAPAQV
jgi:glycosyltransferase involved in cell wall biosynthesis